MWEPLLVIKKARQAATIGVEGEVPDLVITGEQADHHEEVHQDTQEDVAINFDLISDA